jgi:DNA-binding MarR family transcriptional regulator
MPLMNFAANPKPAAKTPGIERLGFLVHDVARLLRKRFEQRGSEYGLSAAQWRCLVRLVKEEGMAQARLAELLEIEPISVSRLLDRMEDGGWVERRQGVEDRRVRMVFPTPKAREAFSTVKSMAVGVFEQALSGLDEAERAALIHGLDVVAANLSDGESACAFASVSEKKV